MSVQSDSFYFSSWFYHSMCEDIANYWFKLSNKRGIKCSESELEQYKQSTIEIIKRALNSGELPVYRTPDFAFVSPDNRKTASPDEVIFYIDIKRVLDKARPFNLMPDLPIFMADYQEMETLLLEAQANIKQSSAGTNNLITQLCSRYHPTNGLKVYYHGMGEWVDVVAKSKDPAQTDITRWGFGLTATTYFRLSHEDSITLERVGKVKTNTLFPIDPKLDARGQYYFLLPEFTEFKKDDVVADIPPHEYKELCNKYYGDIPESESDNQADIEQVLTPPTTKPRKKLKPLIRETNEALLLIHALLKDKGVNYLDELSAVEAWGLIIAQQFKNDLIKTYPEHQNSNIIFNGGDKLNKSQFLEKYRKRFK